MAIAAAYGGPLFNLLFGSGFSLMYVNISRFPNAYVVTPSAALVSPPLCAPMRCSRHVHDSSMPPRFRKKSNVQVTTAGFVLVGLISSVIVVSYNAFKLPRKYAIYLFSLYAIFCVLAVLFGINVLNNPSIVIS